MNDREFLKRQEQRKKEAVKALKEVQRRNQSRDYTGEALDIVNHPEKYYD